MQTWIRDSLPKKEIRKLEFMVGEFSSWQTMLPANGQPPVQYRSVVRGSCEGCDRFLRLEQYSDVPTIGLVSSTVLYSFNKREGAYDCYGFSSAYEQPLRFRGNWEGENLVLVSEPVSGYCGLDRFRHTLKPVGDCRWDFLEERWELTGFRPHIHGTYLSCPV